jgi:DNA-binding CsgD family transcriptional regulator
MAGPVETGKLRARCEDVPDSQIGVSLQAQSVRICLGRTPGGATEPSGSSKVDLVRDPSEKRADRMGDVGSHSYDGRARVGFATRTGLVDREAQLAVLEDLWLGEFMVKTASIVITGDWGTGKTALLDAACTQAGLAGVSVARTRGRNGGFSQRFGVAEEMCEALWRQSLETGAGPNPGLDRLRTTLAAMRQPTVTPAHIAGLLLDCLTPLEQPLLFAVDDANAADEPSLMVLNAVVHRMRPGRAHLLVTTNRRPPGHGLRGVDWLAAEPGTRLLQVGPLSVQAVELLTEAFFAQPVHPQFVEEVWHATGGRPLLLIHLLSALERQHGHASAAAAATVLDSAVPEVASDALMRVAPLRDGAWELLQGLAVLGDGTDIGLVRALAGLDSLEMQRGIDLAIQAELIEPELPLRFTAPIVRTAIYHDMTPTRRGLLHASAARLLAAEGNAAESVCNHLLKTEPAGDPTTARIVEGCGRAALAEGNYQRARECFLRSLGEPPQDERVIDVLLALTSAELQLKSDDALRHVVHAARIGAIDAEQLAILAAQALRMIALPGAPDSDSQATLRGVLDRLPPEATRPRLELALALCRSNEVRSPAELDALARLAGQLGPGEPMIAREASSYVLQEQFKAGRFAGCDQIADQMLLRFDPAEIVSGDRFGSEVQLGTAAALLCCGRFEVDEALMCAAAAAADRRHQDLERDITALLALSSFWQGELDRAISLSSRSMTMGGALHEWGSTLARACLAASLLEKGSVDEALLVDLDFSAKIGADLRTGPQAGLASTVAELFLCELRGHLWMASGQPQRALEDFATTGARAAQLGVDNPAISAWRAQVGRAEVAVGGKDRAHRLLEEHLARTRVLGDPRTVGSALQMLAALSGEDGRVELLTEAVQVLDQSPARLEAAKALLNLGTALLARGDETKARSALRRSAHLGSLCGADTLVEAATVELHAAGCRPRRAALTGWTALTPAELRVAELAASGATNSEIARRLYVSDKTVEGHLGKVYRKLGIHSRLKLPALVATRMERRDALPVDSRPRGLEVVEVPRLIRAQPIEEATP